mgnify:CR=1 FL=1
MNYWRWPLGGVLLGVTFFLAVVLVKPIGVSTQFVILDGLIGSTVNPELVAPAEGSKSGYASSNAYLNKSGGKYAKNVANPLNYGLVFVLSMALGGYLGRKQSGQTLSAIDQVPTVHRDNFGGYAAVRYLMAFIGGVVVLWGARLAGGCTSGHMMSGMMQTALSGYLFAAAAFAAAIPTAVLLYKMRRS